MIGAAWALVAAVALAAGPGPGSPPPPSPASSPDAATERPVPPPEGATREEQADYWFRLGRHLGEREEDYLGAAAAFERSLEIIRTPEALYNRAVAYDAAERVLEAIAAYEEYAREVGAQGEEAHALEPEIERLRARVGTIELRLAPGHEPSEIRLDGSVRARDAFPALVLPGRHEVVLVEAGGERRVQAHEVEAGQVWTLDFTRPPAAEPPPPDPVGPGPTSQPVDRRGTARRGVFYGSVAATGVAGAAIGLFGGLTLREHRAFSAPQCGTRPQCEVAGVEDYPAEHERLFYSYRRTTNAMVGVTAGLAVVSLVVGIVAFTKPRSAPRRIGIDAGRGGSTLALQF